MSKDYKKDQKTKKRGKQDRFSKPTNSKVNLSNIGGKMNDISWYNKNPLLTKFASVVNFLKRVGSRLDLCQYTLSDQATPGVDTVWNNDVVPGICTLFWIPTPGRVKDANSPINWCASKFFETLRLKNISISAYDPIDVMFYLLACDSIFSMYAFMVMIYSYIKNFLFRNKYYPRAVIESMNVDYQDIVDNLAEYAAYLSIVADRIKILRVPKAMSYIARHMHMSAQIYKDHDDDKAQLYNFVPGYLYKYDPTAPALIPINVGFNSTKLKLADIKSIMDQLTQAVLPDEDLGIIAADIEKFFGGEYWTVATVDWDTKLDPVYNKEMLWQIHNANFLPYTSVVNNEITQTIDANLNTIAKWDPEFTTSEAGTAYKRILDSDEPDPTGDDVVESTRLMFTLRDFVKVDQTTFKFKIGSCGSEILTNCKMTQYSRNGVLIHRNYTNFVKCGYYAPSGATDGWLYFPTTNPTTTPVEDGLIGDDLYSLLWGSVFEYRPICYLTRQLSSNDEQFVGIVAPLNNYAVLEDKQLEYLHENCLMSQFDLTSVTASKW